MCKHRLNRVSDRSAEGFADTRRIGGVQCVGNKGQHWITEGINGASGSGVRATGRGPMPANIWRGVERTRGCPGGILVSTRCQTVPILRHLTGFGNRIDRRLRSSRRRISAQSGTPPQLVQL